MSSFSNLLRSYLIPPHARSKSLNISEGKDVKGGEERKEREHTLLPSVSNCALFALTSFSSSSLSSHISTLYQLIKRRNGEEGAERKRERGSQRKEERIQ